MAKGKAQFVSAAGQFYLAYGLAVREISASLTLGNAPSVDVMASSADGRHSLSFQVKTSSNAYQRKRYGNEGYEWAVGAGVIGNYRESFWYALIDLQAHEGRWNPIVFFVPSRWVAEFVKPGWSMCRYFLPTTVKDLTVERWDLVQGFLAGDKIAIEWSNSWPKDKLVEWGKAPAS
jgi:hypothetical protein